MIGQTARREHDIHAPAAAAERSLVVVPERAPAPIPPAPVTPTIGAQGALAHLTQAIRAGQARLRHALATRMSVTAGAVCVAGALHGALDTPWMSIALAAGAGVVALHAADADTKADARSVVDSLGAVALYTAVRDACREAAAASSTATAVHDEPRRERGWNEAAPSWPRASTTVVAQTDLRDRELTPEHDDALAGCRRGDGSRTMRRQARQMLAAVEQRALTISATPVHAVAEDGLARVVEQMRSALQHASAAMRRARLMEEATQIVAWNGSSVAARRHTLRWLGKETTCAAWSEDEELLASASGLVEAVEERARGQPDEVAFDSPPFGQE